MKLLTIFYSDTANAIPVDLANHGPAVFASIPLSSFSSPKLQEPENAAVSK